MAGFQLPAFSLFQWQIPAPLKGNWNRLPPEGDKLLNAEIDWLSNTTNTAYQFQCGGNSPVALSQLVALYVDNRRCGSDVAFWFPDTGFELVVPAHNQGLFPVFTNALQFYAIALNAAAGDVTILQILNSLPPPISLLPASQTTALVTSSMGFNIVNSIQMIPVGTSGTVTGLSIQGIVNAGATNPGSFHLFLIDGTGKEVWEGLLSAPTSGSSTININLTGIDVRFVNGLTVTANGQSNVLAFSQGSVNVYYTTP